MNVALTSSGQTSRQRTVTLTATVGSSLGYPPKDGEVITFKTTSNILLGRAGLKSGKAVLPVWLSPGSYKFRAYYKGSENYDPSTSNVVNQVIQ